MKIKNSVVIVTGGGSGMGAATAKYLAQLGAKLALLDINKKAVESVAKQLNAYAVTCDVTKSESVEQALLKIEKKYGKARIVVNCAGVVHGRRMVNKEGAMPLAEFEKVITINLIGTFNVMRLTSAAMMTLAPIKESEERGIIINTASIAAFEGQIGQIAYSASKGGIVGMTLPAARELAQFGIRVMTIAPGLVDTPMFSKITAEARASLQESIPFPKRLVRPEEFALLVEQVIVNAMLNGSVIRLDGAIRLQPK